MAKVAILCGCKTNRKGYKGKHMFASQYKDNQIVLCIGELKGNGWCPYCGSPYWVIVPNQAEGNDMQVLREMNRQ